MYTLTNETPTWWLEHSGNILEDYSWVDFQEELNKDKLARHTPDHLLQKLVKWNGEVVKVELIEPNDKDSIVESDPYSGYLTAVFDILWSSLRFGSKRTSRELF